ncbi:hypothetical protein D9756_010958 [Leucocoprinus leucothites]|uniref:Uncharacterized protein n=1 Tax=Leucocoprinus leucothites TaxID=201217 RepID=A0A8H5CSJ0_9AGAR|nr:hypothetical protein D9756_010958 [Leucoagaricus leucothites]
MGDTLWTLKYQTLLLMATGRYNLCNHKVVEESPPNKEAGVLHEPNKHLSPEQLEAINQATAGLSEEQ